VGEWARELASVSGQGWYEVLGVAHDASGEELKAARARLVHHWHPDKNRSPYARARTIEVLEAYAVLSDPDRRKAYDQFLIAGDDDPEDEELDNGIGDDHDGNAPEQAIAIRNRVVGLRRVAATAIDSSLVAILAVIAALLTPGLWFVPVDVTGLSLVFLVFISGVVPSPGMRALSYRFFGIDDMQPLDAWDSLQRGFALMRYWRLAISEVWLDRTGQLTHDAMVDVVAWRT
jgi:curved DNA-binding protein CbpA